MPANKLKAQLLFITMLPLLITIALISAFILYDRLSVIESELFSRAENVATQASVMAEFPLYSGHTDELNQIAALLLQSHQLTYTRFLDTTDNVLVHQQHDELSSSLREFSFAIIGETPSLDDFSTDKEKRNLGTIQFGIPFHLAESRRLDVYLRVLSIAIIALLIGTASALLFSRKLTNSIGSLIATAKRVEQRDFSARTTESGTGELYQFQHTFNQMIESLQRNDEKLHEKIQEATASLNSTVSQLSDKNIALARQREETIQLERSKAILEERERIMRDMHDGIGGQLVASLALLEQQTNAEVIDNVRTVLSECLEDLRLIIHSFSMQDGTLASLLADFKFRQSRKLEQLHIDLDWFVTAEADSLQVNPQISLHVLRILQEAFTNIIKHAHASRINFTAKVINDELVLTIQDNGKFKMESAPNRGHGIKNMISRSQRLRGSFDIRESSSGGCELCIQLPLSPLKLGVQDKIS